MQGVCLHLRARGDTGFESNVVGENRSLVLLNPLHCKGDLHAFYFDGFGGSVICWRAVYQLGAEGLVADVTGESSLHDPGKLWWALVVGHDAVDDVEVG